MVVWETRRLLGSDEMLTYINWLVALFSIGAASANKATMEKRARVRVLKDDILVDIWELVIEAVVVRVIVVIEVWICIMMFVNCFEGR